MSTQTTRVGVPMSASWRPRVLSCGIMWRIAARLGGVALARALAHASAVCSPVAWRLLRSSVPPRSPCEAWPTCSNATRPLARSMISDLHSAWLLGLARRGATSPCSHGATVAGLPGHVGRRRAPLLQGGEHAPRPQGCDGGRVPRALPHCQRQH